MDDWSEDRLRYEEERLFIGFDCQAVQQSALRAEADTGWGVDFPTSVSALPCAAGTTGDVVGPPSTSYACPSRDPGVSRNEGDTDDDPGWEFEDK